MNEIPKFAAPRTVTTGPIVGSRKVYAAPNERADIRVPFREIALSDPNEAPVRVYDPSGPYTESDVAIDLASGLKPVREAWIEAPQLCHSGAARDQARGQRQRFNGSSCAPLSRRADAPRRQAWPTRHPVRIRPRRDRHRRDDLCRPSRESGARGGGGARSRAPRRRRELRRRHPRIHHAGIRARGGGARTRDHSRQHQSPRTRADGDRPQFSGQGQRQHRQFRGELGRRRGSREDGVGDPLGRRHGHGPLDRPQHPQHPLLDPAQRAGSDRNGADLPGAGEGRRRSAQARLGSVQGHAHRAGRAGRRLFHHPRRRAPGLRAADREARHRHRLARRLDHGALVPRGPSRELPL